MRVETVMGVRKKMRMCMRKHTGVNACAHENPCAHVRKRVCVNECAHRHGDECKGVAYGGHGSCNRVTVLIDLT